MKKFNEYFTFDSIVEQLVIQRSKFAFYINKNAYLDDLGIGKPFEIQDQLRITDFEFLKSVLPPRKEWSRPRTHGLRSSFTSSIDLNQRAIKNRIYDIHRRFLNKGISFLDTPLWYQNLRRYIFNLKISVFDDPKFSIVSPEIFPAKKDPKDPTNTDRRPLAKFIVQDKIILSLTNKYLTKIFDTEFWDCSFAFRSKSFKIAPTYHDAVSKVKEFREDNLNMPLYVAECDIKKFFDCVDHGVVLENYKKIKAQLKENGYIINLAAEKILTSYLNSYSFCTNVFPKNDLEKYWELKKDLNPKGNFGWVDEYIEKFKSGALDKNKVGIPQGGALSGLIVNIIMHSSDQIVNIKNQWNKDFLYVRYCDDMVIIHKSEQGCTDLFYDYLESLKTKCLYPHFPVKMKATYCKHFWHKSIKTREVYSWSRKKLGTCLNSPWISFVGYMVNYSGDLKIRKRSYDKQIEKHLNELKKVVKRLDNAANEDLINKEMSIIQSFEGRLSNMAVGKIDISNYKNMPAEMCWGAGFKLLHDNKFANAQLQRLDRSRKQVIISLERYLTRRGIKHEPRPFEKKKGKPKPVKPMYPHSYYSLIERKKVI